MKREAKNVLGTDLITCSTDPLTGYYRDGCCHTGFDDMGTHTVCAQMTEAFLMYTRKEGNDLTTPRPGFNFPGLKPGDFWCLCASRWKEALDAGVAPKVKLEACHVKTLNIVSLAELQKNAIDANTEAGA